MKTTGNGLASGSRLQVTISGFPYSYARWRPGDARLGQLLAIDTQTALIDAPNIPSLVMVTASDGRRHVLIHPDDLGEFILYHSASDFVCHDVAFDFWAIHQHLSATGETEAQQDWKQTVFNRRLHDAMLLDVLIRLAGGESAQRQGDKHEIAPRDLVEVVRDYTGMTISGNESDRPQFGEIIGQDWEQVDPRFFKCAITDPIVTLLAYREMREIATDIMFDHGYDPQATNNIVIDPNAIAKFGLLTEAIQVEAAIALAQVSRNGLHTHTQRLAAAEQEFREELRSQTEELHRDYPGVLIVDHRGRRKLTPSGLPCKSAHQLDQQLPQCVEDIRRQTGRAVDVPRTNRNGISHSVEKWGHLIAQHPFLGLWSRFEATTKRKQFFDALRPPVIHPSYQVLVRTGRTSCSGPNIQQVPRDDIFREAIVPSPGHLLLRVDYSFVELVTLARTCQSRYGVSRLGDVIRNGIDPHCYTAARLYGISLEEFMRWKTSINEQFKLARQRAKPVNFGVPGGMGATTLVDYARNVFGVNMTLEDAKNFHRKLTVFVYPELDRYLADNSMAYLADRLGASEQHCREAFLYLGKPPSAAANIIRNVVSGQPYCSENADRVWDVLVQISSNPDLTEAMRDRTGSPQLAAQLFETTAVTLTGRVRGNTTYTQQRNTPFQGLASDGAKRALGRLVLYGYRAVGFIHDEILVELPDQGGYVDKHIVDNVVDIIRESMQELTGDIPVSCEYALSDRWSKNTELIVEGNKVWAWTPPD